MCFDSQLLQEIQVLMCRYSLNHTHFFFFYNLKIGYIFLSIHLRSQAGMVGKGIATMRRAIL